MRSIICGYLIHHSDLSTIITSGVNKGIRVK